MGGWSLGISTDLTYDDVMEQTQYSEDPQRIACLDVPLVALEYARGGLNALWTRWWTMTR